jgi:predicted transcriptional regulator
MSPTDVINVPAGITDAVMASVYATLQLYLIQSRRVNTRALARSLHVSEHRVRHAIHALLRQGYLSRYEYDGVRVRCKLVTPNCASRLYRRKSADGAIVIEFGRVSHARLPRTFIERLEEGVLTVDAIRLAMLLLLRPRACRWSWAQLMETLQWSRSRLYRAMRCLREANLLSMEIRGERYLVGTATHAQAMRRHTQQRIAERIQRVRRHIESLASSRVTRHTEPLALTARSAHAANATELVLTLVRQGIPVEDAFELVRQYGARALEFVEFGRTSPESRHPPPQ